MPGYARRGNPSFPCVCRISYLVDDSMKKARQSMTPAGLMHKGALRAFPALRYAPGEIRPVFPKRKDRAGKGPAASRAKGPSPADRYNCSPCKRSRASVVSSSLPKAVKRT